MASEKPGYTEILADLLAKRAALDNAIAAIQTALTIGALGQPSDVELASAGGVGFNGSAPVELPTGAFIGKSLPAAIKIYLSAVKRKQTTKEIATALKEGGVESTSGNFENIVTGTLNRLKAAGEVLRFKDGWGLSEFYPDNLRARLAQESKPKGKKSRTKPARTMKPRKGARGRKRTDIAKPSKSPKAAKPEGGKLDDRIYAFLKANPGRLYTRDVVAASVNEPTKSAVSLAIARLIANGKAERDAAGNVSLKRAPVEHLKAV
jgi:hypothetical protein